MSRLLRALTFTLILGLTSASAFGQAVEGGAGTEEESSGGPLPGYIATGCLAAAAIFVLCKSARR